MIRYQCLIFVVEEFRNFTADSLFVEANKLKLQNRNIKLGQHFATKLKVYPSNHAVFNTHCMKMNMKTQPK
jgi:hypothetical protein